MFPVLSLFRFNLLHPNNPENENNHIEKRPQNPVVANVPVFRPVHQDNRKNDDPENICKVDDQETKRDIPQLLFPRTGKQHHQEYPRVKLFKA